MSINMNSKKIKAQFTKETNPRVGLIVLSTDNMIEKDFSKVLSDKPVDLYVNRIKNYNPVTAENLKNSGAFIPGIRPGDQTANYIDDITTKLTTIGAIYITSVCLLPEFLILYFNVPFYFGGTSLLIVVIVVMDLMAQVQSHLLSHQYEGMMKKANLKGIGSGVR